MSDPNPGHSRRLIFTNYANGVDIEAMKSPAQEPMPVGSSKAYQIATRTPGSGRMIRAWINLRIISVDKTARAPILAETGETAKPPATRTGIWTCSDSWQGCDSDIVAAIEV